MAPRSIFTEIVVKVIGPRSVVVVSDPVIIKRILTSSPETSWWVVGGLPLGRSLSHLWEKEHHVFKGAL